MFQKTLRKFRHRKSARNVILKTYETDTSRKVSYRINNLGFRGEDFDRRALYHIYLFGCSLTFGHGIKENKIWGALIRRKIAVLHRLKLSKINLANFGVGGASNSEIARLAVVQCAEQKPNLAIIMFT